VLTEPLVINKIVERDRKVETQLKSHPEYVKAVMNMSNDATPTTMRELKGGITQDINMAHNRIVITYPIEDMDALFESVWAHVLETAQYNTHGFKDANIMRLQVSYCDTNRNK